MSVKKGLIHNVHCHVSYSNGICCLISWMTAFAAALSLKARYTASSLLSEFNFDHCACVMIQMIWTESFLAQDNEIRHCSVVRLTESPKWVNYVHEKIVLIIEISFCKNLIFLHHFTDIMQDWSNGWNIPSEFLMIIDRIL